MTTATRLAALTALTLLWACATLGGPDLPSSPDEITEIQLGESAELTLDEDAPINLVDGAPYRVYQLELQQDATLSISATSSDLPPTISLYGPDGQLLGWGPAVHDEYSNLLVRPSAGEGTYTVVVSSPSADMTGSVALSVDTIDEPQEPLAFPGTTEGIVYDDGSDDEHPRRAHPLQLDEPTGLHLTVDSSDFTPRLALVDADTGETLDEAYPVRNNPPEIRTFAPAGDYKVVVIGDQLGPDGRFELTTDTIDLQPPEQFEPGTTLRSALNWERAEIAKTGNMGLPFELQLEDHQLVYAQLHTDEFEGLLVITDEDDNAVAWADSRLVEGEPVRLGRPTTPGDYTLWVSSVYGGQGTFELTVDLNEPPLPGDLELDAHLEGTLTEGSIIFPDHQSFVEFFDVTLEETKTLDIEARSQDFDTYLFVTDEDHNTVADNHDADIGTTDSRITREFEPGEYTIGVTSFTPHTQGSFELTVERDP